MPRPKKAVQAPTIEQVLDDRGAKYGPFNNHAAITQQLEDIMRGTEGVPTNWDDLSYSQKEALHMVAHKIGRILNGDPDYVDSWTDIIGYTRLVEKELQGEVV
jgi:hypothetical protein